MRQNNKIQTTVSSPSLIKLKILLAAKIIIVFIIASFVIGNTTVRYTKLHLQPVPLMSSYGSGKTCKQLENVQSIRAQTFHWDEFYQKIRSILTQSVLIRVYRHNVKAEDIYFPQSLIAENDSKKNRTSSFQSQKRCAIVGSGGILLNSSCGREIDEHDFVIRTNLASVSGFENDVGRRTNLTSMNGVVVRDILKELNDNSTYDIMQKRLKFQSHLKRIKHLKGSSLWYTLRASVNQKKHLQLMVKELKDRGIRFNFAYSPGNARNMTKRLWGLNGLPSAGIIVFTVASSFCEHISLYGFYPFFEHPLTKQVLPYHYYDLNGINFTRIHNMPEEYQIFKELNSTGQIRLVTTCTTT